MRAYLVPCFWTFDFLVEGTLDARQCKQWERFFLVYLGKITVRCAQVLTAFRKYGTSWSWSARLRTICTWMARESQDLKIARASNWNRRRERFRSPCLLNCFVVMCRTVEFLQVNRCVAQQSPFSFVRKTQASRRHRHVDFSMDVDCRVESDVF